MRLLASSLAFSVSLALVACGADAPPPAAPVAPPPTAPTAPPADSSAATPPAPVVDSNPTERTADQKARDDARLPLANALMDAFTNYAPELSHDKKRVLFASRRDGNREYYLGDVAKPDGAPVAITHGPERASGARFSRDGKSIFFLRDSGADENYRIYQVGLDGKNETCLTPGAVLHRDAPAEPRGTPGVLVYTQHDVKSAASELVVQKVGGEPKVVYTDPAPAFLSTSRATENVPWSSARTPPATSCSSRSISRPPRRIACIRRRARRRS